MRKMRGIKDFITSPDEFYSQSKLEIDIDIQKALNQRMSDLVSPPHYICPDCGVKAVGTQVIEEHIREEERRSAYRKLREDMEKPRVDPELKKFMESKLMKDD